MSGQARRRSILQAAVRDRELVEQVPPVVAAGFGILPLRRLGDVLTVACLPRVNRQALRLLREVLGVEVVATPFEEGLLHEAIRAAYFSGDETVNYPTFTRSTFLEDPGAADALRAEKVERLPAPALALAADSAALLTVSYRSQLRNLDLPPSGAALPDPSRLRVDLEDDDAGWRRSGEGAAIHLPGRCGAGRPRIVLTEFRTSDYRHMGGGARVVEHTVRTRVAHRPSDLPLVIHPTEVQLVGVDAEGRPLVHAYDALRLLEAGSPQPLSLSYYFLSYGNRMHRTIHVRIHETEVVPADKLSMEDRPFPWGKEEFARWFGVARG